MSDEQYARTGRFMFFYYNGTPKSKVIIATQQEYVLTADPNGHYYVSGRINNYPVDFLVDTGASYVAIPQAIADKLNIKGQYPVSLSTANGSVTGSLTRLEQISFGAFTLYDVKAVIIPSGDDDTVLMGMNVLENFDMTQNKKKLILRKQVE